MTNKLFCHSLAAAASSLLLGFALCAHPYVPVNANWVNSYSKCENDTMSLFEASDNKVYNAALNYSLQFLDSIAPNVTSNFSNGTKADISVDMSETYTEQSFADYRDSCSSANGMVCFFDFNASLNATLNNIAIYQVDMTVLGFPMCSAKTCTAADVTNTTRQSLPQSFADTFGVSGNFSVEVLKFFCHSSKCRGLRGISNSK